MSLLFAMVLKDSIVMASDSRTTWTHKDNTITYQDGTKKTFILNDKIGVSTCRNASINKQTIEFHFNKFKELHKDKTITKIPKLLKEYFLELKPTCDIVFFVAGYDSKNKPHAYKVYTQQEIEKVNCSKPTSFWEGEKNFASRAFGTLYVYNKYNYKRHQDYKLPIEKFTLKKGVEYAKFIINTSIEYMKFFDVKQTIGGGIDVLAILPSGTFWYEKNN